MKGVRVKITSWKQYQKWLSESPPFDANKAASVARGAMIIVGLWFILAIITQHWFAAVVLGLMWYREWGSRFTHDLILSQEVLLNQYVISLVKMEAEMQTWAPALDASHEIRTQYDQLKQEHHELLEAVTKLVYKLQAQDVPGFMALEEARTALALIKKQEDSA